MRVIAGSARGFKLRSVPGDSTRPITDRAKESLFSILGDWVADARLLDLFGGSGAVGIEALSREAEFVQFVERNRQAVETIRANLTHCKVAEYAQVLQGDSFAFLEGYRGDPFDIIFIAPPQYKELWSRALLLVDSRPELLGDDGVVVVQIDPKEDTPIALRHLVEYDRRRYGSVLLLFYEKELTAET